VETLIRLLPDGLANQIAAGEVVQRPASVVKELLENAVDAGADEIVLKVREGGKTFIQVSDNGRGMNEVDARLCFERHATSKIREFDDMQRLHTYGFRGEALASIAAVSQLELRTRMSESETGTFVRMEGGECRTQEPVVCEKGSAFTVRNLFFNVPARRNFLKSPQVEHSHIAEEFNRVALAYPAISFQFFHGENLILKSTSGNLARRICSVFGESYRENLLPVNEETDFIKITGFVGKPGLSRKTRGEQYFFANNRFIRNGYLHHAVSTAFEGLLSQAAFPFYVLFLDISPEKIDINVHPTKTEIKFENERFVYSVIQAAVRKALQQSMLVPAIDFEPVSPWLESLKRENEGSQSPVFSPEYRQDPQVSVNNWEKLLSSTGKEQRILEFESPVQGSDVQAQPAEKPRPFNIHGRFLIYQIKSGMMLIDMQRAWERIVYEELLEKNGSQQVNSQQLLFPVQLDFSEQDFRLLEEMGDEIRQLGIAWEPFGRRSLQLTGLPPGLAQTDPARLFQDFLEQYRWNTGRLKIPRSQAIQRALAKKSSQCQSFQQWNESELLNLVNRLFACRVNHQSPDGQLISRILSLGELASLLS
jgi:DNA mismatch repair protein MutL